MVPPPSLRVPILVPAVVMFAASAIMHVRSTVDGMVYGSLTAGGWL